MTTVHTTIRFPYRCEQIWNIMTSLTEYTWRTDLDHICILEDVKQFQEITKDGYVTTFHITTETPYTAYAFTIENANMKGHWSGNLTQLAEGTEVLFTEEVSAKNPLMKPFIKSYLKKQQHRYIEDLSAELQRRENR